jgi:hypothetical protein
MPNHAHDTLMAQARREPSQQERFNEIADGELRMVLDGLFRSYSKRGKLHRLAQHVELMFDEDLVSVPMDDPKCQLTTDAREIQKLYKQILAYADQYYKLKGAAA